MAKDTLCQDYIPVTEPDINKKEEVFNSTTKDKEETEMAATFAFEVVIILHSKTIKDNSGNDATEDSVILVDTKVIAKGSDQAKLIASRDQKLADLTNEELGRIEIKVRHI